MLESRIERHLVRGVKRAGGDARKLKGRRHECDRLVLWPCAMCGDTYMPPRVHFVETKAPGKKPRQGQLREHQRLRDMGFVVLVLDTIAKVNDYLREAACPQ